MSTRIGGDRVRWGSMGILGSLAWKPFGVAKNPGSHADKPRKKWRVPRGVCDNYGLIGQPKQRRGGRRQRRRECNEHIAKTQHVVKTDGGGWVAVAGDVSNPSSIAGAPRVHAANVDADYRHVPQTGRDPARPGQASEHYQGHYRPFFTQGAAWMYDDRGLQHVKTGRAQTGWGQSGRMHPHAPFLDQRPQAQIHHMQHHHTQQRLQPHHTHNHRQHHHSQLHRTQQQQYVEAQYQYIRPQPHGQHVSHTKRIHVQYEVPHQGGQCYEYGHCYQGRCS